MYTNLVRASRQRFALEQAEFAEGPRQTHPGLCGFPGPAHDHVTFSLPSMLCEQRRIDHLLAELPVTDYQRQIVLADRTIAKFLM